jgi:hypothetical protein
MENDNELEHWKRMWQGWNAQPVDWVRKAQLAHRREAALRASYWAALVFETAAVALAVSRFGVLSWFRLGVAVGALLLGFGAMVYFDRQGQRSQRSLSASPHGLITDLILLHERELYAWTSRASLLITCLVACAGGAVALQRIAEAVTSRESLLGPIAVLLVYGLALVAIAAVGVSRVRLIRQELKALQRVQAELSQ